MDESARRSVLRPALDDLDQLVAPLSDAERRVADALATLDAGWTVYVQPRVGLDQPDFIAVHDQHGVCAIEVKDWEPGAVRRNEYAEFELLIDGEWYRTVEQPRFEASRFRSTIFDQFFALPEDGGSPPTEIRAIVVLPNFTTADATELLDECLIHDGEELVSVYGGEILDDVTVAVTEGDHDPPRAASIRRIREHIVPSERVVLPEDEAAPVSAGVIEMAVNPSATPIRRVRGAAGTGKSFGLTARAAQLAAHGKRVLVLSFNVTLANRLQAMVTQRCREIGANPTLVTASNFHTLCTRIVQDAEIAGYAMTPPPGAPWTVAIVAKVQQAFEQGFERDYDAILIDEGQDFRTTWWNLLRDRMLAPDGEMLLVADPTQDIYNRFAWTRGDGESGPGFEGEWLDLDGGYRVPADLSAFANDLALRSALSERLAVGPAADHAAITGERSMTSIRSWTNVDRVNDLGRAVGREVVRLLQANPALSPGDVAFVCEYHHDGVAAVRVIERAGYPVHHIFSRDPDAPRRRRKHRFWPGADAVKGCTIHSFKGWESPALVVGIGSDAKAERAAFVALTRAVAPADGRRAIVSIVNANRGLREFGDDFAEEPLPEPGAEATSAVAASRDDEVASSTPSVDSPPVPVYASNASEPRGSVVPPPAPAAGYIPPVGIAPPAGAFGPPTSPPVEVAPPPPPPPSSSSDPAPVAQPPAFAAPAPPAD